MGVRTVMKTFDFFFGASLRFAVMRYSDNLSRTLQNEDLSAAEGQAAASVTISSLSSKRTDEAFNNFWAALEEQMVDLDVEKPTLPRKRKMPKRFEIGNASYEYPGRPKDMYRQKYFEVYDVSIAAIRERFNQPGFQLYRHLQDLLLKAFKAILFLILT